MRKKLFFSLLFLIVLFEVFLLTWSNQDTSPSSVPDVPPKYVNQEVLWSLIQEWRTNSGKGTYITDQKLCEYAERRVQEIQTDFSHKGYRKLAETEIYSDDKFSSTGENLSEGINSEPELLSQWLTSPSHRDNLEDSFTYSCVSCENNYCVQLFGK